MHTAVLSELVHKRIENKINKFLSLMESFGISDLTRTGKIALARTN
jgi:acetolactate synthase small subunit